MSEMRKGNGGGSKNTSGATGGKSSVRQGNATRNSTGNSGTKIGVSNPSHRSSSSSGSQTTHRPAGPEHHPGGRPPVNPGRPNHRPPEVHHPMGGPGGPRKGGIDKRNYDRPPRSGRSGSIFSMVLTAVVVLIILVYVLLQH